MKGGGGPLMMGGRVSWTRSRRRRSRRRMRRIFLGR